MRPRRMFAVKTGLVEKHIRRQSDTDTDIYMGVGGAGGGKCALLSTSLIIAGACSPALAGAIPRQT